ncbi:hypothetical protein [Levilactobacillus sp. HBUAS70063]|uniref:hypothetical protein n=1 Tax=Levilactobacillus sp. HBUAS70063 TaxID=3109359 RepID=UPI003132AF0A
MGGKRVCWRQTPLLFEIIGLLVLIYRRQRQGRYPLPHGVVGLALLVMMLLPVSQVADAIMGFVAGLRGLN